MEDLLLQTFALLSPHGWQETCSCLVKQQALPGNEHVPILKAIGNFFLSLDSPAVVDVVSAPLVCATLYSTILQASAPWPGLLGAFHMILAIMQRHVACGSSYIAHADHLPCVFPCQVL